MRKSFIIILLLLFPLGCVYKLEYQLLNDKLPQEIIPPGNIDVALVLGGGGSKGYIHAGVIEVLEKNNIPIDLIVGTSIGSIVGALYADEPDAIALMNKLRKFSPVDALSTSFSTALYGPITGEYIVKFLCKSLKHTDIEDLLIPFAAVATNLDTNEPFIFRLGPIIPALHASSAVPGLFTPIFAYGYHLVDGGAIENVPVKTAKKFKPKMIIAVNIASPADRFDYDKSDMFQGNSFGIAYQALNISFYELSKLQTLGADIQITPQDLNKYYSFSTEIKDIDELFQIGRKEAEKLLPQIRLKMSELGISLKKKKKNK